MPTFITQAELVDFVGQDFVTEYGLDDPDGVPLALRMACDKIAAEIGHLYPIANLGQSDVLKSMAIRMAAYYLSVRRGNPAKYLAMFEQDTEFLNRVRMREAFLPDIASPCEIFGAVTNYTVVPGLPNPIAVDNDSSQKPVRKYPYQGNPYPSPRFRP